MYSSDTAQRDRRTERNSREKKIEFVARVIVHVVYNAARSSIFIEKVCRMTNNDESRLKRRSRRKKRNTSVENCVEPKTEKCITGKGVRE